MRLGLKIADRLGGLEQRLAQAEALTPDLMAGAFAGATRLSSLGRTPDVAQLHRLIACEAWTDAALMLVELDLPRWTVRRLVREDGEWLCTLSSAPHLPPEFDDAIEVTHRTPALAMLCAYLAARRSDTEPRGARLRVVPAVQKPAGVAVCCDSFA